MSRIPDEQSRRITAAGIGLLAYATYQANAGAEPRDCPLDVDGIITDLMTDLRHYCHVKNADFEKHLRRSAEHFNAETAP